MAQRRVLVLGASGYVGGRLVPRLLEGGQAVRCLARSPAKLAGAPWAPRTQIVAGDLSDGVGMAEAFADIDVVVHLVHSIGTGADFASADRDIALSVAATAQDAGVSRVVYLGGLGDITPDASPHLRSRAEVADVFLAARVPATVLRAGVIIGSGSASFEVLRHLVEKLPVMITPRWVDTPTQPIAIRDVLRYLVAVVDDDSSVNHDYDIGGDEPMTYLQMMRGYAQAAGLPHRMVIRAPWVTPRLSTHWLHAVTPVPFGLARELVLSQTVPTTVRAERDIRRDVPGDTLPYVEAVRVALARVRDRDVETSWREATTGLRAAEPHPDDPQWSGGVLYSDVRTARSAAPPAAVFAAVSGVGGARGWPTHRWAWGVRGLIDRLAGGTGLRRGRRDPDRLRVGDALDFWRVEAVEPPTAGREGLLRLRAEMRLPGHAWLEFRLTPDGAGTRLTQRALFAPKGLLGRAYWWALAPLHRPIFHSMANRLAADAAARPVESTSGA
ncbi:MAG TPA: SDR family oxidoreductase [Egibacteraceae bacterium]|nr:SDR family oxidoreductase [Egibacteraceae bacterium]